MPRFECSQCDAELELTVDELGARVRAICPRDSEHGNMKYVGRYRVPWYKGNHMESVGLICLLLLVLASGVGELNLNDGTELVTLGVACLAMFVFELGRFTSLSESVATRLHLGFTRLAVFFFSTATAMALSQTVIDNGEKTLLLTLTILALIWHMAWIFITRGWVWRQTKAIANNFIFATLAIVFAFEIEVYESFLKHSRSVINQVLLEFIGVVNS
ncbi:MAG: hypothetical protein AAGI88_12970 [Pseudomonadota bacterium]